MLASDAARPQNNVLVTLEIHYMYQNTCLMTTLSSKGERCTETRRRCSCCVPSCRALARVWGVLSIESVCTYLCVCCGHCVQCPAFVYVLQGHTWSGHVRDRQVDAHASRWARKFSFNRLFYLHHRLPQIL